MFSRKKTFREIVGEKEVEACQKAFTIVFFLRRDWLQSGEEETAKKYTDDYYKWITENRAFLPSDLYNIFGTINRYMCHFLLLDTPPDVKREERVKVSDLITQTDRF